MTTIWDITEKSVELQTAAKIIKYIAENVGIIASNGDLIERLATIESLGMKIAAESRELIEAVSEYEQSKTEAETEAENAARAVMDEAIAEKKKQAKKPEEPAEPSEPYTPPEHITETNTDDDLPEYTEADNTDLGISILIKDEAFNHD